jgi:hypothetical protein
MQTIKGQTFKDTAVWIDDTEFIDCKIDSCELIYCGGKFGWTNTSITNVRITLRGFAAYTAGFLEKFALIDAKGPWHVVKLEYVPEGLPD